MKALFTAATGMDAQQVKIGVIANNIANLSTTGFRSSRAEFQDLLYQTFKLAGGETASGISSPSGLQVGSGVKVVSTALLVTPGTLEQTGRSLDIAIEGDGFLQITLPNGDLAYTRAGSLAIDASGALVTQDGFAITGAPTLNTNGVDRTIGIDGTISARVPPATAPTTEGQLQLYKFPNPAGLSAIGRNLYSETTASGSPTAGTPGQNGLGTMQQGFLESSNVNIAEELIRMIIAQRAYELNSKVIQTADQMLSTTSALR